MKILPAGGFGRAAIGGLALGASAGVGSPVIAHEITGSKSVVQLTTVGVAVGGFMGLREMAGPMTAPELGRVARGGAMAIGAIFAGVAIYNDL